MELEKIAFYVNPDMIKFLLEENLALKLILYKKGIINPEEYSFFQKEAAKILNEKTSEKIDEIKKNKPELD
jgi:hypothetical protein